MCIIEQDHLRKCNDIGHNPINTRPSGELERDHKGKQRHAKGRAAHHRVFRHFGIGLLLADPSIDTGRHSRQARKKRNKQQNQFLFAGRPNMRKRRYAGRFRKWNAKHRIIEAAQLINNFSG